MHFLLIQHLWKPLPFNQRLPFTPNSQINRYFKPRWANLVETHSEMASPFLGKQLEFVGKISLKEEPHAFPRSQTEVLALHISEGMDLVRGGKQKEVLLSESEWAHRKSKDHEMTQEHVGNFAWLDKAIMLLSDRRLPD